MKLVIDFDSKQLAVQNGSAKTSKKLNLYSKKAFELLSDAWVKVGWNEKYPYTFSWMGRPIIQLPEDMIRTQEVIFNVEPSLIIETGIAHGGSLIYYASLFKAMGKGRVVGVDIEIRPHNKKAIKAHPLYNRIQMIEGSSIDPKIVARVKKSIKPKDRVLVILDSNHTYEHVLRELEMYSPFVSKGSYIVATDGVMNYVADVPRAKAGWNRDNPERAARDFVRKNKKFKIETPRWPFNESKLNKNITHWPGAWIKRVS